ncbi:transforming acidic coiled-coil-containing protein 3 [Synchiropus splendidus]|uniref:transforming acidic coiled-coil-containing protein 3 n=1 Tax=Synchiropus splendidus TaxID=270530 RepID=UPI00237DB959|nr:transforming acidic coiled-coil-containing protein 3 [Synchiropus splendidus]
MSLVDVNDENRGVGSGGKLSGDIFALEQPTGRPSILRQTDNLPNNRPAQKGIKVCFQTPRRDPVTKRIVSPTKMASVDECARALESLNLQTTPTRDTTEMPQEAKPELSLVGDDMPIQTRGGYQLDFDNLDTMNPFQSSNKMLLSPAKPLSEPPTKESPVVKAGVEAVLDDTLPYSASAENSLADGAGVSSTDSSVVTASALLTADWTDDVEVPQVPETIESAAVVAEDEAPAPPKGSYNFDFDNLDSINPFQTGGSKIQNSPVSAKKVPEDETAEVKPTATVAPLCSAEPAAEEPRPAQDGPVVLEFNFDDGAEVKRKPPKKLGKRPPGLKVKDKKPVSEVKPVQEPAEEPVGHGAEDVAVPKGAYSFDFDKFDDPNFNPFGTKTAMTNSPKCDGKSSDRTPVEEQLETPAPCIDRREPAAAAAMPETEDTSETPQKEVQPEPEKMVQPEPETPTNQPEANLADFEEFVPGTTFMSSDLDGQIDYLEQFGSCSFKESALRKQSLYLKFDPLLRDSPKKPAGPKAQAPTVHPIVSRLDASLTQDLGPVEPQKEQLRLIDDAAAPLTLVPPFTPPLAAEDAIIEVLQYSQKDLDAAIARVREEAKQSDDRWSAKCAKMQDDTQAMRKIVAEFELMITKQMEDREKEREEEARRLQEVQAEKEQVANDLNSTERSLADLFKRLQKYKDVVEGFKKNEEMLKACAQDYLARVKKEEQRYQALKAHAEEKISNANNEIADVRSKFKAEVSALQVQLRREQMKVQSLEKSLDMKEKEVEELTKLCDELIKNVQKS